jgi:uncharacterized damage-inducible protein DinB
MKDIRDLLDSLGRTPRILSEFVRTVPEDRLDVRRKKGFWTVAEHVVHLAHVQPMLLSRFERFMNEEHPEFTPYIPEKTGGGADAPSPVSTAAALDQFADYRRRQLLLLEKADDNTWRRTATHPEYETYSLYILTRHALMHDYWHMYRMEELWLTRDELLTELW